MLPIPQNINTRIWVGQLIHKHLAKPDRMPPGVRLGHKNLAKYTQEPLVKQA